MTRYRTIVADPPWHYDDRWGSYTNGGKGPVVKKPLDYNTMTVEEIAALPVAELAADDARLFLWTTNRYLRAAFDVAEAWGFNYRQTLTWRKTGNPSPLGGSVAPVHTEFLLVATKGTPALLQRLKSSIIDAPAAIYGHSVKPECFLDHIEQISPGPYVELFARRARFGWDYWGDQSLGTAEVAA